MTLINNGEDNRESPGSGSDGWSSTVCYMCYNCCGIKARKEDGIVVEIRGDPANPYNKGKLCAKGKSGVMSLYDPYRLKAPLKRTNPTKGMGLNPGWQEISWEQAMEEISTRLAKVQKEDPRKLVLGGIDFHSFIRYWAFASAFGTPNIWRGGANYFCGNGMHSVLFLTQGSFYAEPDFDYCNYCLLIGSQLGFMVGSNCTPLAQRMADARARGMKVVAVDPICTNSGSKAEEWVPIRPGTDAAFALGLAHLLVNEYNIYDSPFIKRYTNGPYLIGQKGYYLRDKESGKPLVWSDKEGRAKPYDDEEDPALEGSYSVEGVEAVPAFQLLREKLKHYPPERVAEITTVPAHTLRRIAEEFGQAARIGSKILIQGKEFPFRPVCAYWSRGAIAHKQAIMSGMAIQLLNILVGAVDMPGGMIGVNPCGPFWAPQTGPDGLIVPAPFIQVVGGAYPARPVKEPDSLDAMELFPVANHAAPFFEEGVINPDGLGINYKPEIMINCHSNPMLTTSNPVRVAELLKNIPYTVSFAFHRDETVEFADIVLPDAHYLEKLDPFPNHPSHFILAGLGEWYWMMASPVVKPPSQVRHWADVMLELAERLGILKDYYMMLNASLNLNGEYRLEGDRKYSWQEISDRWARGWLGPDVDLPKLYREGFLISSQKKVEEAYCRPFITPRIPIYLEHFLQAGEDVREVTARLNIPLDTSGYQPLPEWNPCPGYEAEGSYDLYAVNFKVPFHTFSFTAQNPWLNELAEHHPYAYRIIINNRVADSQGIQDGEMVVVESKGGKIKGIAKVTECVHPEVVGIAGCFGHWSEDMPVARGKGANYNKLFPEENLDLIDPVSTALDCCLRVKVRPSPSREKDQPAE